MKIMSLLTGHKHYWGIPHERDLDRRMVLTCYECGAEREIRIDLHPSFTADQQPDSDKLKAA